MDQRDTYFGSHRGRLKLREEAEGTPQLIAYDRPDQARWRESRYRLVEVEDGPGLKAALAETLGIKAEVRKRRRLFRADRLQVHLDVVQGLGSFIEFELAVGRGSDLNDAHRRLEGLKRAFEIQEQDLIAGSYGDLVLAESASAPRSGQT